MAEYRSIKVERGPGGFGGPLVITPTEKRNKVMYITGGGAAPECLNKIVELTGLIPVNGFKTNCPEDELALVIIDCGGTLRCGIYPKKGIPTINTNPVGKSGPIAKYITEYISKHIFKSATAKTLASESAKASLAIYTFMSKLVIVLSFSCI